MARHKFSSRFKRFVAVGAAVAGAAGGLVAAANAGASEAEPAAVKADVRAEVKVDLKAKKPVERLVVRAAFAPAGTADVAPAVTYNTELVPLTSWVQVKEELRRDGGTRIELRLRGLVENRVYGAHVHTKPCGKLPADAGPHYQDAVDPVQPSVDPAYANPENEVWLDVKANGDGSGRSVAVVDWRFREGGARSVVVHEAATSTHEGHAGTAGARLACVNVPFK
ncbi:superoxide dismutase family protein [Streptomyces sp. NPDC002643]